MAAVQLAERHETRTEALDATTIRADFPILQQTNGRGQPLTFLDSASSSQKPLPVLEAMDDYYRRYNANIHRGVYGISELATAAYEEARAKVAAFVNAADPRECVFVRNTTEGINLVANAWGRRNLREGDLVVCTVLDHHSNLVPWQLIAEERGARIAHVGIGADGGFDWAGYDALLAQGPKVVSFTHVSNAVGTVNDAPEIIRRAKAAGATTLVDAAQSAPHQRLDVQALGADFVAFSGHKMLAPMGSGVLWGRLDLLEQMPPFMGGGGAILRVDVERSTWADVPAKFEAGTPAVGEAIGLGVAVEYLSTVGMERIHLHERTLGDYARRSLASVPGVTVYGPADPRQRSGIVAFTVDGVAARDVALALDEEHIAVRAGKHCCQPLLRELGVEAVVRASFYLYNTPEDVDRLVAVLDAARRRLPRNLDERGSNPADPCGRRLQD